MPLLLSVPGALHCHVRKKTEIKNLSNAAERQGEIFLNVARSFVSTDGGESVPRRWTREIKNLSCQTLYEGSVPSVQSSEYMLLLLASLVSCASGLLSWSTVFCSVD